MGFDPAGDCLDYGAGTGLFARMMRDRGWRYFASDKYAAPFFMDGFMAAPGRRTWQMISAFEVFEHLADPAADLDAMLGSAARLVFFTTDLWERQGPDWPYLNPQQGHHVFFYTSKALRMTAARFGFEYHDLGFVKCLARPTEAAGLAAIRALGVQGFGERVLDSFLRHVRDPYKFANLDHQALRAAQGGKSL